MTNNIASSHKIGVKRSRSQHLSEFKESDPKNQRINKEDSENEEYDLPLDENILYAVSHNQVLHNKDFKDFAEIETRNTCNVMIVFYLININYLFYIFEISKIIETIDKTNGLLNNKSDLLLNSINQLVKETKKVIYGNSTIKMYLIKIILIKANENSTAIISKLDEISHLLKELPFYNPSVQLGLTQSFG